MSTKTLVPYNMANKKKCQIPCYMPHRTPANMTFNKWFDNYEDDLVGLYEVVKNVINIQAYISFESFALLVYNTSSKHLI